MGCFPSRPTCSRTTPCSSPRPSRPRPRLRLPLPRRNAAWRHSGGGRRPGREHCRRLALSSPADAARSGLRGPGVPRGCGRASGAAAGPAEECRPRPLPGGGDGHFPPGEEAGGAALRGGRSFRALGCQAGDGGAHRFRRCGDGHGNGLATTFTYDGDGRIASLKFVDGSKRLSDFSYSYADGIQQIDPSAPRCPDRVTGGSVSNNSEAKACTEAKRLATQSAPRGCYARHCKCDCN